MAETGSGLSHFEEEAAKTPRKMPLAIVIGSALLPFLLILINWLAPNEAIEEAKKQEKEKEEPAAVELPEVEIDDI